MPLWHELLLYFCILFMEAIIYCPFLQGFGWGRRR
jgi:hypothetical protein